MSGTGKWRKPGQKPFDGRTDKRIAVSIPVYLARLKEPHSRELTSIENFSTRGACAISRRSWQSGEEAQITLLSGEFPVVGTVVYCEASTEGRFSLGLEFPEHSGNWKNYRRNLTGP